ncbi:DUF2141 domain-containing protein [uncultured Nitrospira sp.]|uniref:DUF2141 domain-containing protein n=1 Tax=uncultured Nitrospira sp. TaxID=157176 RepID=UPI0031406BB3
MYILIVFLLGVSASFGEELQLPVNTCPREGRPIHIHVHGIKSAAGSLKAVLYGPDPESFLVKGAKADKEREPAQKGSMTLCLAAPVEGKYAVVVYHDENDNHKFDRNFIGLPTEGFGVSNNPSLFLAAPKFEELSFEVNDEVTHVDVDLKY